MGVVVFLLTWVSAIPTMPGAPGLTWDETYYHPVFKDAAGWVAHFASDPAAALSREGIDAGWQRTEELPPVVRWIGAVVVSLPNGGGWWNLAMMRLYPAAALGLTIALLYIIARRLVPGWWSFLPPVLYILHPRLWGHGQIAATETVFVLLTVLAIWIALHDLRRWKWRLLLGVVLGLTLATKVNGIILIVAIVFWLPMRHLFNGRRQQGAIGQDILLSIGLIASAPLIALAVWPWMWHDTGTRIHDYYIFVRDHAHQGLWYFGRPWNFNGPPTPVSYPLVIAHLVTPVALLVLFWLSIFGGLSRFVAQRKIAPARLLLVLLLLAPLTASSLPGSPKYDGIRLFLPVFAPAALLISIGLRDLLCWIRFATGHGARRWPGFVVAGILLIGFVPDGPPRPHLDFYNSIAFVIGRGQTVFPFEQTYWLNAFDARAVADINRLYPPGSRIMTRGFHGDTLPTLQAWSILNPELDVSGTPPLDAHIIQNRRGFWGNSDWIIWQERHPLIGWGRGPTGDYLVYLFDGRPPGSGPLPPGETGFPN